MKYKIFKNNSLTGSRELVTTTKTLDAALTFISNLADFYFHSEFYFDYEEVELC